MAWDIETTDEFQAWWAELSEAEHEAITVGVTVLEEKGPALGRPRVDTPAILLTSRRRSRRRRAEDRALRDRERDHRIEESR